MSNPTLAELEALAAELETPSQPQQREKALKESSLASSDPASQTVSNSDSSSAKLDLKDAEAVSNTCKKISTNVAQLVEKAQSQVLVAQEREYLYKSLRVARLFLRSRPRGSEVWATKAALENFVRAGELQDALGYMASVEGVTCVVNAIYMNNKAYLALEDFFGAARVLAIFKSAGSAAKMHRCARVLNLCIQNQAVCADKSNSGDESMKIKLAKMVEAQARASVACLAYCVRSKKPTCFPGNDRSRVDLVLEILTWQMLLASQMKQDDLRSDDPAAQGKDFLTQMGILLVELLLIPADLPWAMEVRAKVVTVLTFMPPEYANFLSANKALAPILELLEREMHATLVQGKPNFEIRLTPSLVVLSEAANNSPYAKQQLKTLLFAEQDALASAAAAVSSEGETSAAIASGGQPSSEKKKNKMEAEHVPPGSLLSFVIKSMTTPSSNTVSRLLGELMWTLCENKTDELIRRAGIGNAMGFLQLKGLLNIPGAS